MSDKSPQIVRTSLHEDYERLLLSFRAFGGGLWDYDVEADRLFCNDRWYALLGVDPVRDPIASIGAFRPHIHPEDVRRATEINFADLNRMVVEDERYHVEFRIVRPSGEVRLWRSIACVVRDELRNHLRAVGCVMDMSPASFVRPSARPVAGLTSSGPAKALLSARETECLLWVSVGKTAWESGEIMGISRRTVEDHLASAVQKLNAVNKVHAVVLAIREGLI